MEKGRFRQIERLTEADDMDRQIPNTMRKLIVTRITSKFREATEIVSVSVPKPGPNEVLIKNR